MKSREECIKEYCLQSTQTNPLALALELMQQDFVRMHGPEHHYLTAAVLATAYGNKTGKNSAEMLEKLQKRCMAILPAVCAHYGACGDVQGAGAFISVLIGATHLSGEEWRTVNEMTLACQEQIAQFKGPRCCKRTTMATLVAAMKFLNEKWALDFEIKDNIRCIFTSKNPECHKSECRYFDPDVLVRESSREE